MPTKKERADFMLTGPVRFAYGTDYVQARIKANHLASSRPRTRTAGG